LFFCCISNGGNNNKSCHHRSGSFPDSSVMWGGISSLLLTSISSLAPFVATVNGQRQGALPHPCFRVKLGWLRKFGKFTCFIASLSWGGSI
jgi:hypothetical protein